MPDIYFKSVPFSKEDVTLALESGVDGIITEAEREGDDWCLFGYCHIHEWEWGYLMLSELAYLRLPFGLTIERDIYTARKYVRDFLPQDE
mgnify:CR=1 FL=1